jgi:flagellar basal-body rod protein FlgF
MERYIHIAAGSMRINIDNQRLIASSLANQNTTAFKRDIAVSSAVYVNQQNDADRVFPSRGKASVDLEYGKLISTDNPMDVAIEGDGFFIGKKPDGSTVLTRRGDFHIGADRLLRNGENLAMDGDGGPISLPLFESMEVSRDGTVLITPQGATPGTPQTVVDRLKLVKTPASNVQRGDDGTMRLTDNIVPPSDAAVTLYTKGLETSNVSAIDAMVDMLSASRTFEIHVKLLATAKELDDATAKLMRSSQ